MHATLLIDQYILYFCIYSVFGYIGEVLYCSIPAHHFVNRGFLYGPWIPIYGFGGLAIHTLTQGVSVVPSNPLFVFLASMVLASLIEYIGSWLLETWFGIKLWDYSSHRCNIHGRVCLLNSTIFGCAGLVLTYGGHDLFAGWVDRLPEATVRLSSHLVFLAMTVDFVCSVFRMQAFRNLLKDTHDRIEEAKADISFLGTLDNAMARSVVKGRVVARLGSLKERYAASARRMLVKWPGMKGRSRLAEEMIERWRQQDPLKDLWDKVGKA